MKVSQGDAAMENEPAEHKISLEQLKRMLFKSGFMKLVKKKKKDGVPLCPPPPPSMLEVGGRAGSEALRTGTFAHHQLRMLGRAGPALPRGSTTESAPLVEVWVSQP